MYRYFPPFVSTRLPDPPYIPGSDAAGYVEKVGSEVVGLTPCTRVFVTGRNSGSYAEYIVTEYNYVFPLHGRLTFAQVWRLKPSQGQR